jgi:succinoglycan biosynthesis transport protein ExoP
MKEESRVVRRDSMQFPAVAPLAVHGPEFSVEPQAGSVLDYWRTLCRRKLLLAVFAAAGLAIGVGVALVQAPVYRAHTTLEIQEIKGDALAIKANPVPDPTATDALTDIQTQIKILQSRTLIEQALDDVRVSAPETLDSRPASQAGWRSLLPGSASDANPDKLVEKASKNLKVSEAGQTRIVEVSFDATDPKHAALFVNALTSEFIK